MSDALEQIIIQSWTHNAGPWVKAIRNGEVESRVLATNQALLDAVSAYSPKKVLDLGCGEGWLARALAPQGVDVLGVEVVEELYQSAKEQGAGRYLCLDYVDVSLSRLAESFDVIVANFSLIGKASVDEMLARLPKLLNDNGVLIVQTLHPRACSDGLPYEDGWRMGSWDGFSDEFTGPAPWFFRTIDSWEKLLEASGFDHVDSLEPMHPALGVPASLLFVARE